MYQVTLDKAKADLPDLINAAVEGEQVFIRKDDKKVVQLIPVELSIRRPQFGSAKGLVEIADDFDSPLKDFDEYNVHLLFGHLVQYLGRESSCHRSRDPFPLLSIQRD